LKTVLNNFGHNTSKIKHLKNTNELNRISRPQSKRTLKPEIGRGEKTNIIREAIGRRTPYGEVSVGDILYFNENKGDGLLRVRKSLAPRK